MSMVKVRQDQPMAKSIPALVEPTVLRWARESIDLPAIAAEGPHGNGPAFVQRAVELAPRAFRLFFRCECEETEAASPACLAIAGHCDFRHACPRSLKQLPQLGFVDGFGQARNKELASIWIGHVSRRGGV